MDIDESLELIQKINEATKNIPDEETRVLAFRNLMLQAGMGQASSATQVFEKAKAETSALTSEKKPRRAKSGAKGAPDIDPELNLEPDGKQTFADFVSKRKLSSHLDKICGSIYYLREVLGLDVVGTHQLATCFRDRDWDWPSDFSNTISQAKSKKRLSYDSMEDIRLPAVESNKMKRESSNGEA